MKIVLFYAYILFYTLFALYQNCCSIQYLLAESLAEYPSLEQYKGELFL